MSAAGARWSDLGARIASAVVLVVVSGLALLTPGPFFALYVSALVVAVTWEQARMLGRPVVGAPVLAAIVMGLGLFLPASVPILIAASALVFGGSARDKRMLAGVSNLIVLAGAFSFIFFAFSAGLEMLLWLIGVVVLTDLGGYFGGRTLGGPKLWPAVSPKKTWSGTLTGWAAAAIFTFFFPGIGHYGPLLILAAVFISAASQAGDLFESHVKRRCGIKDSSSLIPGHGGVWDRFDGMLTAAIAGLLLTGL